MPNSIRRLKFINKRFLGRKRGVITNIIEDKADIEGAKADEEEEVLMKEVETETIIAYNEVLRKCMKEYETKRDPELNKEFHLMYLKSCFSHRLPPQMAALDASQPWMLYWLANSIETLKSGTLSDDTKLKIAEKLLIINPDGGPFGGGLGQLPHLASNYAAINALALCDNIGNCWAKLNRDAIYRWLISLKQEDGSFKTCLTVGETDTRGVYCAISIASMLNILTAELCEGVVDFLVACQSYEGGFGGCPHEDEAHGGYTFCAFASLAILGAIDKVDTAKLALWCSQRQYNSEKGFCGRSNKLVDGCYSFWVGSTAAILEWQGAEGSCINKEALRQYILYCCQSQKRPGLRDKPGTNPDFYHTNYVLLGLAIADNATFISKDPEKRTVIAEIPKDFTINSTYGLTPINPIYGLPATSVYKFRRYFK